ncbi:MAG TPA: biotin transporter BioY, partial [bacterium]|nr:biotin transporter BioY [bacterium]
MTAATTLTDALLKRTHRFRTLTLVLTGTLLITLLARVAIPLPFSPIPFTGQTLAVLLVGALLGSRLGALTVAAYVAQGAAGLPVFAQGAGPAYLAGPTGGYLLGCIAAAWITGCLAERGWDRSFFTAAMAMLAGNTAIYLVGLTWLMMFTGPGEVLSLGLYPFIVT